VDTICLHGAHPPSQEAVKMLKRTLEGAGVAVLPLRQWLKPS